MVRLEEGMVWMYYEGGTVGLAIWETCNAVAHPSSWKSCLHLSPAFSLTSLCFLSLSFVHISGVGIPRALSSILFCLWPAQFLLPTSPQFFRHKYRLLLCPSPQTSLLLASLSLFHSSALILSTPLSPHPTGHHAGQTPNSTMWHCSLCLECMCTSRQPRKLWLTLEWVSLRMLLATRNPPLKDIYFHFTKVWRGRGSVCSRAQQRHQGPNFPHSPTWPPQDVHFLLELCY